MQESQTLHKYVQECIDNDLCHEIHTSERRSFRSCRRRWDWAYRQNYYPRTKAKPLEFGIAYHIAMETYYNPETWTFSNDVKVALALQAFVDECESQRNDAQKSLGNISPEVEADYDERVQLGRGMIDYYFKQVAPKEDIGWTPVKVEIEFLVPIPNVETGEEYIICRCEKCHYKWRTYCSDEDVDDTRFRGLPVVYGGRLDMLAQDTRGNYWIFDWKTAAQISPDKEYLLLDDQIATYVWALRKLGLPIQGFVYHEQRKGFPKSPEMMKRSNGGRLFSVSKMQETDYSTYVNVVARQDIEGWGSGAYDEFLAYLKHDGIKFHDRFEVHKTDQELIEIEKNVSYEALDMVSTNLRLYPASGKFNCTSCAYRQPCIEMNAGQDYKYALDTMFDRGNVYYEEQRQRLSTEKIRG